MTDTVDIEYGTGTMAAELPAGALVVRPGRTYLDPPGVDPVEATRHALASPLGMPPLPDLVRTGSRVVIAFPDRVKGGEHEQAHRKVTIPLILQILESSGVRERDISFLCAEGLHRKNSRTEMARYLPPVVLARYADRLSNHDAEDPDGIVDLGHSRLGDKVDFNRSCAEADLTIVLGHVQGNPYGGFSGGHKTFTTGLTTWQSIAAHHTPATMHRQDFIPISTESRFRSQLRAIGERIEEAIGRRLFLVDAVVGAGSTVLGTFAGAAEEVEAASWPLAERRTNVHLDVPPVDVIVFGLPRDFHYGPGMGTNPILMAQAIAAVIARCAGLLRPGGVAIAAAECDGWFNDEWFPSYRETFEQWQRCCSVEDLSSAAAEISSRPEYVAEYRSGRGYHPFHGFSMLSMAAIGTTYASRIYVAGAKAPGMARAMGLEPTHDVAEALRKARKYVGADAAVAALPGFLTGVPPHLWAESSEVPGGAGEGEG